MIEDDGNAKRKLVKPLISIIKKVWNCGLYSVEWVAKLPLRFFL